MHCLSVTGVRLLQLICKSVFAVGQNLYKFNSTASILLGNSFPDGFIPFGNGCCTRESQHPFPVFDNCYVKDNREWAERGCQLRRCVDIYVNGDPFNPGCLGNGRLGVSLSCPHSSIPHSLQCFRVLTDVKAAASSASFFTFSCSWCKRARILSCCVCCCVQNGWIISYLLSFLLTYAKLSVH